MQHEINLSLDEIKRIEFEILKKFVQICDDNSLRYSLAYGSLLGAIRHKGFIPWDDDIDVMMPRPDYLKFLDVCKSALTNTCMDVISIYTDAEYYSPLTKMYKTDTRVYQQYGQDENIITGVYIDIFVVDGLPSREAETFYNKAQALRRKWGLSSRKLFSSERTKNYLRLIIGSCIAIPFKLIGVDYYKRKYDSFCSQYSFDDSEYAAVVLYGEGLYREKMQRKLFDELIFVEFDGVQFKSIPNPDVYLKNMYGDYMRLPDEKDRVSKHPHIVTKVENY